MSLTAHRCPNGHLTYPSHWLCPECGEAQTETVDLADQTGDVLTWTESMATPAGVPSPNRIAIVEFDVDGESVRAIGGVTGEVDLGDEVRPVYVDELRDPEVGIRHADSQAWDGYRFEPVQ